ncbi:hypothetical protein L195_g033019, partial [Trifolium pratense]
MDFTFTATIPSPTKQQLPPEPPDKGGKGVQHKLKEGSSTVSFRDKVLGSQTVMIREKVDLLATNQAQVELIHGNRLMPMLHVERTVIEELSIPWKDALVVKLLGKNLGYGTMKQKLESVWRLAGAFELMHVGNAFYMVKFDSAEDKNKVISGGPWMIYDHYLAVRHWSPTFNANTAKIDKTMVWIRIPSLNLLYYDESVLWALASMVGAPVKVDLHTLRVDRGRFARMCVEIDLTQPVVGRVGINGEWYKVQYEGLHIICTQCGCYGHILKDCTQKKIIPAMEATQIEGEKVHNTAAAGQNHKPDSAEKMHTVVQPNLEVNPELLHGDWIKVERRKKGNKINSRGSSGNQKGTVPVSKSGTTSMENVKSMNGQVGETINVGIGQKQKARFKKKRPRHDNIGISNNGSITSQKNNNPFNVGVYDDGYTANKQVVQQPPARNESAVQEKNVDPWLLTVVYASPREQERGETWNKLRQLAANINEPWLMVGDFNEIASPEEKKGGAQVDIKKCQQFNSWINECNLLEVTTAGTKFTWRGPKWNGRNRIFKKLDRVLCNISWRLKYDEGFAKVLPRVQSDHHPIIVLTEGEPNNDRDRPFRFEAAWFCHAEFHSFLKDKWGGGSELIDQLYNLTPRLKEWN